MSQWNGFTKKKQKMKKSSRKGSANNNLHIKVKTEICKGCAERI
jgi:hypothetical protein